MSLYASLLDASCRMEYVPKLFVPVQDFATRKLIVHQLRDFVNLPGQDLLMIEAIVQHVLSTAAPPSKKAISVAPTDLDRRKIQALQWLDIEPAHARTGLVLANQLLRWFLLYDKVQAALLYVRDHRSKSVQSLLSSENEDDEQVAEHLALECLLDALAAEDEWQQVSEALEPEQPGADGDIPMTDAESQSATTTQTIMHDMQRREYVETQRGQVATLVEAATRTQQAFRAVLEYPGGWLCLDPSTMSSEDAVMSDGVCGPRLTRRTE